LLKTSLFYSLDCHLSRHSRKAHNLVIILYIIHNTNIHQEEWIWAMVRGIINPYFNKTRLRIESALFMAVKA
jgi:hypothetical protein